MKVIIPANWLKTIAISIVAVITFNGCSQENGRDTDLVQAEAYIDIADVYRRQGQYRSAFIELQNALQLTPGNERALLALARTNIDLGNANQAVQILEPLTGTSPNNESVILLLAEAQLYSNNYDQAITLLNPLEPSILDYQIQRRWVLGMAHMSNSDNEIAEQAFQANLATDPKNVKALVGLSQLSYYEGNLEQARSYLDQATEVDANDLDLLIWAGVYSTQNGQYPEAEQSFSEALEIMGRYDTFTPKRLSVLQAILIPLQMQQKNQEALRYSQIIAETPQGQLQNSYNRAVEMFQQGNFADAQEALNDTLAIAPNHPDSNILLGMTNFALGNYSAAATSLSSFVSIVSSSQPIKVFAATQIQLGNVDEAIAILRDALPRFPEDGSLIAMIGSSQQAAGNFNESIESFNQALVIEPDMAEIYFSMAGSYYSINEIESATQSLLSAISLNPEFDQAKASLVSLYITRGELVDAGRQVQEWLADNTQSILHNNLAGIVAQTSGNTEQARTYYNNSLNLDPTNLEARLSLARISIAEQDFQQAESEYNALLAREPTNADALNGLLALGRLQGSETAMIQQVLDLVSQYPGTTTPSLVLSQFFKYQGEQDRALEFAQLAFQRSENLLTQSNLIDALIQKALNASSAQDFAAANRALEEAIALENNNLRILATAARVANAANNTEQAFTYIDQIKTLQPDSGIGAEVEGDLLLANNNSASALDVFREAWSTGGRPSAAIKVYATLIDLNQLEEAKEFLQSWGNDSPYDGNANLLLAMQYQRENSNADAIRHYEIAIPTLPGNLVVLNNLAWLYQDDNPERALILANRASTLFPNNPDAMDTYGWILFKQGRQEEAIDVLERAQELAPDSELIAEHLDAIR
ncbi:MAG: tetratricopeptide repeat protein [Phycisphaeraceae bacterium]|nr:tetratricopeptide repeat protein [Phycisphaeraceae bacterium]